MSWERWYEFEQVETMRRSYYVKAATLAEARAKVRSGDWSGDVSDYPPDPGAQNFRVQGPGRLADQEYVEDLMTSEPDRSW